MESKAFAAVLTVLRALAANDERIIAWFRARHAGRKVKGGIIDFDFDETIAHTIDLADFAAKIETKAWDTAAASGPRYQRSQWISPLMPNPCTAMSSGSGVVGARGLGRALPLLFFPSPPSGACGQREHNTSALRAQSRSKRPVPLRVRSEVQEVLREGDVALSEGCAAAKWLYHSR